LACAIAEKVKTVGLSPQKLQRLHAFLHALSAPESDIIGILVVVQRRFASG
jgi:hypothetical protein